MFMQWRNCFQSNGVASHSREKLWMACVVGGERSVALAVSEMLFFLCSMNTLNGIQQGCRWTACRTTTGGLAKFFLQNGEGGFGVKSPESHIFSFFLSESFWALACTVGATGLSSSERRNKCLQTTWRQAQLSGVVFGLLDLLPHRW